MKTYEIIAQTVLLQQQIFNCSVDQVWEKHIHPRIREVHSLENIRPYLEERKKRSLHPTPPRKQQVQGIFVEHRGYVITLIDTEKGKLLQVYRAGIVTYKHPHYNPLPDSISIILRRNLNIRRVPPISNWGTIKSDKFDSIINQNLQEA